MGRSGPGYKNREARRQVLIPCRIKSVRGWGDACIHNVSSRGMMIACDDPLAPGEYLDLRRGRGRYLEGMRVGIGAADQCAHLGVVTGDGLGH